MGRYSSLANGTSSCRSRSRGSVVNARKRYPQSSWMNGYHRTRACTVTATPATRQTRRSVRARIERPVCRRGAAAVDVMSVVQIVGYLTRYSRRVARAPGAGSLHFPAIAGPFVTLGLVYGVWYSYSVLLVVLVREFGWPRALAAGAFSVFVLVHGGAGPLVGRLVETLGARLVITAGALTLAAGLLMAAETRTWWHLYFAFGVIAAAGSCAAGWVPAVAIVRRWHPERFGTAVGIASAGTGVGIVAVVPATQLLIASLGWRWALRVLAAVILIWVLSAVGWFAGDRPQGTSLRRPAPDPLSGHIAGHWTLGMALRSWRFWAVGLVFLAGSTATQTLLVHQVAYLVDKGVGAMVAATVASVVGLASIG